MVGWYKSSSHEKSIRLWQILQRKPALKAHFRRVLCSFLPLVQRLRTRVEPDIRLFPDRVRARQGWNLECERQGGPVTHESLQNRLLPLLPVLQTWRLWTPSSLVFQRGSEKLRDNAELDGVIGALELSRLQRGGDQQGALERGPQKSRELGWWSRHWRAGRILQRSSTGDKDSGRAPWRCKARSTCSQSAHRQEIRVSWENRRQEIPRSFRIGFL